MATIEILENQGPLDEMVLGAIEQSWGFKLPKPYRNFLLKV